MFSLSLNYLSIRLCNSMDHQGKKHYSLFVAGSILNLHHLCMLSLFLIDGRAEEGFVSSNGAGRGFLTNVHCNGYESELKECVKEVATGDCKSAGVTCHKSSSRLCHASYLT